ncbi:MAG: peptidase M23 [Bacteroidetes bacterium GWA2_31_9]|nr:MAG: peptidase M23 [Bacteroidetes bacterium GWA2_31_9]
MVEAKPKKKLIKRLKHKYKLIIYNELTYEELWSIRLSRLNVFSMVGILSVLLVILTTIIIAFTPLRQYIPGYPTDKMRGNMIMNSIRIDSLEAELDSRDKYLSNIRSIIDGKEPEIRITKKDTTVKISEIKFTNSKEDSSFRASVEEEEKYNVTNVTNTFENDFVQINKILFFPPIKGMITNTFNSVENHFGTDIVAKPNVSVFAVLDGTVILASWTFETGYVIQIQHKNNLVSIYKHVSEILKKEGQKVKIGEPIAIYGNSGEQTTGPHLHFELWYNGKPLNPEDFISFNQ